MMDEPAAAAAAAAPAAVDLVQVFRTLEQLSSNGPAFDQSDPSTTLVTFGAHSSNVSNVNGFVDTELIDDLEQLTIDLEKEREVKYELINGQAQQRRFDDIPKTAKFASLRRRFENLQARVLALVALILAFYGREQSGFVGYELKLLSQPPGSTAQEPHYDSETGELLSLLLYLNAFKNHLTTYLSNVPLDFSPYKGSMEEMKRRITYLLNPLHSPFFSAQRSHAGDFSLISHDALHFGPPNPKPNSMRRTAFITIGPRERDVNTAELQVFSHNIIKTAFSASNPLFSCAILQNARDHPLKHHLEKLWLTTSPAVRAAGKHLLRLATEGPAPPLVSVSEGFITRVNRLFERGALS